MGATGKATTRRAALTLAILAVTMGLYGCGESGSDGAELRAKQEEIRAARAEALRDIRQGVRIVELERQLKGAKRRAVDPGHEDEAPFSGLWEGEAVIRYDSGESDPFTQTIEIDSLTLGGIAGYSEALQNSTTCHGPITYQGRSEGWYQFTAEEQNVAECIDYSELELMPDASGDLIYRETTDVSVSTGTLQRRR